MDKKRKFNVKNNINRIINDIDDLKDSMEFFDERNEDAAWGFLEESVLNLEKVREVLDRDEEYKIVKKFLK